MKKLTHGPTGTPSAAIIAAMKLESPREKSETVSDYFVLYLIQELLSSIGLRHRH